MNVETFDDVLASIKLNPQRQFHLLLGNGFSMAYDRDIFSYDALQKAISDDKDLSRIFDIVETSNFELIMQYLDKCSALITALGGDSKLKERIDTARIKLKKSLLKAVKDLHPIHVFEVSEEQSKACSNFLKRFLDSDGKIYSMNYDLLLYWVFMRNGQHRDGFGRESQTLTWGTYRNIQKVFYLHGMLAFFDNGVALTKEEHHSGNYLLENITARMENDEYPLFVTAGKGRQKLKHIMSNQYLMHCYKNLCEVEGSLVTFGFSFGESDDHIVNAINKAANRRGSNKLLNLYIGVYIEQDPTEEDQKHIEQIKDKFTCKVHIYNTKTADIWGKESS